MKYLLVLGREPALSFSEFDAVCKAAQIAYSVLWIENSIVCVSLDVNNAFFNEYECAGIIKVAKIITEGDENYIEEELYNDVATNYVNNKRAIIGISYYSLDEKSFGQTLAKNLKRSLKKEKISLRYIADNIPLSSGSLKKNAIIKEGAEYCIVKHENILYVGKTIMIQNSDAWSKRDFYKPARDMRRGMMPPKLARILTHLTKLPKGSTILDPFCGTGTLAMEALLAGYNVIASDADPNAIKETKTNLEWVKENFILVSSYTILQCDSRDIFRRTKKLRHVDAIATEPFLGNEKFSSASQRAEEAQRLSMLYKSSLLDWKKMLDHGSMVVIIFPQFITRGGIIKIPIHNELKKIGYEVLKPASKKYTLNDEYSSHGNLLYSREGQHVQREILLLSKI